MEQSDLHGRRLDNELERVNESLTRGAPVESRAEDDRVEQDAADDEIDLTGALVSGDDSSPAPRLDAPSLDEARARSELARHLRPSVFPAGPDALVDCAREEHAPAELVARLAALPPDTYENVSQVWTALGGHREHRAHAEPPAPEPEPEPDFASNRTTERSSATPVRSEKRVEKRRARFGFRFDPWYRWAAIPFGVHPDNTFVEIVRYTEPAQLTVHFGPWCVETTLDNVTTATVTGPYALVKTIGPPHVSLVDTGLTFATNHDRGVCIQFRDTVAGLDPLHLVHHPSLTVTVDDPNALTETLTDALGSPSPGD
jgi:hypothetical protein